MTDWNPRANELFVKALEVPEPDRTSFVVGECGDDAALRKAVETLLHAHGAAGGFLAEPHPDALPTGSFGDHAVTRTAGDRTHTAVPAIGTPGVLIAGRYKLLQQIGEGGMGTVWMADQTEPVKRRVAVKLIRSERGTSATILARFEAERQAIALMDHPHIARLLDAGTTAEGVPYFIMELVKGVPLNEYCDAHRLSIPDRLQLFQLICGAVQHAHQKGIIHRDLKPTNILVESHDGKAVPKVIDFGLAKATTGLQLTEHSLFTAFGSVMGTPLYMAPEQATFNAVDVDTRADIYALGVILYELLTGTTPLTRDTVRKAALDEMLKLIREQEAPTPSSRLSSAENKPTVAANRQMEPLKLGRFVKGDLDWIVLKALSKERDRRYETANGFAADVGRFLNHEPVQAGPVSTAYRMKKFVRRNRGQVIAASLVLFALLAGIAGTTVGLFRAESARREAVLSAEREADERKRADAAKVEAQAKEAEANAVVTFFQETVFAAARPKGQNGGLGHDVSLRDAIAASVPTIEIGFAEQPLVEARLRYALGISFNYLAEYELARDQLERARALFTKHAGPDHPDTLTSMNSLSNSYAGLNRPADALKLREETLAIRKRVLPQDHPDTLTSMGNLATSFGAMNRPADAHKLREETMAIQKRVLPPDHPSILVSMINLASSYATLNRPADALKLFEEVLEIQKRVLSQDHPDTLRSMYGLALRYADLNRPADALKLREETMAIQKRVLPKDHPDTLQSMMGLASSYAALNRPADALKLREETLAIQQRVLPKDHPNTLQSMMGLANSYAALNRPADALKLREETLEIQKRVLPKDHPDTLSSMHNLANSYAAMNRQAEALKLREEVLEIRRRVLPKDHPETLRSMIALGNSHAAMNRPAEALKLHEESLEIRRRVLPKDDPDTLRSMITLANSYAALNRPADALNLREEIIEIQKRVLPKDDLDTLRSMYGLAGSYTALNRHADALKLREESLEIQKRVLPKDHPDTLQNMWAVAASLIELNRGAEAIPVIDECVAKSAGKAVHPQMLPSVMALRTRHFQKIGDAAGCRATAEIWEKLNRPDAESQFNAACYRAIAAGVQAKTPGADAARLAKDDDDRAMQWLHKAVQAGFKDVAQIKKDTDLDSIREREDFKKLLAELEANKK